MNECFCSRCFVKVCCVQWSLFVCVSTECASSSRLVGTFLSVCALTVLCGLVVVAISRLLLQKKEGSPGGAVGGDVYHCTGKVSAQSYAVWSSGQQRGWNVTVASLILPGYFGECKPSAETRSQKLESAVQLYFSFPFNSLLTVHIIQICDLKMMCSTFEEEMMKFRVRGSFLEMWICAQVFLDVWKPFMMNSHSLFTAGNLGNTTKYRLCSYWCFRCNNAVVKMLHYLGGL